MTTTLRAHFDGETLVPDEPVDLPVGQPLTVTVMPSPKGSGKLPIFADPTRTLEEKLAALRELASGGVEGTNIPDEALRRENMYGDDGR